MPSPTRKMLFSSLSSAALLIGGASPANAQPPPPLVVFVCEHGSAKSLAAASFFERVAKERGLVVRAVSRGTAPDPSVPPAVVDWLKGDGFAVASYKPQPLTEPDVASAKRIVAIGVEIGPLVAGAGPRLEKWDDIPPFSDSYPRAREALVARIRALVSELASQPARQTQPR